MEELSIEIELTRSKQDVLQLSIFRFFKHDTFPTDRQFEEIGDLCGQLKIQNAIMKSLEELEDTIEINAKSSQ